MRVISTICRTRRLGWDSPTNDMKCQHRSSCTLTLSRPLTTRTRHKPIMLSCLAVSRIPAIDNQLRVFHAPHMRAKRIFALLWTISHNCRARVKEYLFDELPTRELSEYREGHFRATTVCPFSVTRNWKTTRYDITHMWQVNTHHREGRDMPASMLDSTFAPVVPSVISNSPSTRRTIVYPYTSTNGSHLRLYVHHEAHRSSFNH